MSSEQSAMQSRYSILIQWSDDDLAYIVSLPEFGPYAHTHGETYDEAIRNAQEVLELLMETYREMGRSLPEPVTFQQA